MYAVSEIPQFQPRSYCRTEWSTSTRAQRARNAKGRLQRTRAWRMPVICFPPYGIVAAMPARVTAAAAFASCGGRKTGQGASSQSHDDREATLTPARASVAVLVAGRSVCVKCGDTQEVHEGALRMETAAGTFGPRVTVPAKGSGQLRAASELGYSLGLQGRRGRMESRKHGRTVHVTHRALVREKYESSTRVYERSREKSPTSNGPNLNLQTRAR